MDWEGRGSPCQGSWEGLGSRQGGKGQGPRETGTLTGWVTSPWPPSLERKSSRSGTGVVGEEKWGGGAAGGGW